MKTIAKIASAAVFAVAAFWGISSAFAATIVNGSLTGPVANGGVPTGWLNAGGSPDTNDINNNVGLPVASVPYTVTPASESPDGGTWVGLARGSGFIETLRQLVTDLVVGETYELSWYAGNFGAQTGPGYNGANAIEVLADFVSVGSGAVLDLGSGWFAQSVFFTATDTSMYIDFRVLNGVNSYLSIDGVSIALADGQVPVPGALLLFVSGIAGLRLRLRAKAKA